MARFDPRVFNVTNIASAKSIILTPEDSSTEQRWATETPYLGGLIQEHLELNERHRVLDYGCGIGRMAKELIDRSACSVIGVDVSVSMRCLAPAYVLSDRFLSCPPSMLGVFNGGLHHAISVWTLQHIPEVAAAIVQIERHLASFGKLFVVNSGMRCLPMSDGTWADDGKDVREQLCARFDEIAFGKLDGTHTTPKTAERAFWAVYRRRA